jgi:hypothetical protein
VEFCKEQKLQHYLELHKTIPVFVIFGIGGSPAVPDAIYLLSMNQAKYAHLFDSLLKKYEIPFDKTITPALLWNR